MIRRRALHLWFIAAVAGAGAGLWPTGATADVVPRSGTATFTDLTGGGACALPGEPPDNLHVGLPTVEFGTADVCGAYLDVTGPRGTVRVQVTDHCRHCPEGTIDITRKAFAQIADVGAGRAPVHYELVRNPPLAAPLSLRVKEGSSAWFLQLQVLDHGNPLRSVELALPDGGGWRPLTRTADNHWQASDPGPGAGPFTVRITDVHGQSATVAGITLTPTTQPTNARLYPAPVAPPPPASTSTTTTTTILTPPAPAPPEPEPSMNLLPLACAAALAATICAQRMIGHRRALR